MKRSSNQKTTGACSQQLTAGRIAYLELRAKRANRRLVLTLFLFALSCFAWGMWNYSFLIYPWWYATIPCGLLVVVLAFGRRAALAAKANDLKYLSQQQAAGRRSGVSDVDLAAPVLTVVSTDEDDYLAGDYTAFDNVNDAVMLPVPVTQYIPEADKRLAVLNNLKDDPEFAEFDALNAPAFNLAG